jgi:uncharacterized protein YjbJ (UPF0337 family)
VKQTVGEAVGNQELANSGAADQIKGDAKQAWGGAKDAVRRASDDAHANAESHAREVRAKITSTAQKVKSAVNEKAEEFKQDHKRSA